jgi:hypothetical protein
VPCAPYTKAATILRMLKKYGDQRFLGASLGRTTGGLPLSIEQPSSRAHSRASRLVADHRLEARYATQLPEAGQKKVDPVTLYVIQTQPLSRSIGRTHPCGRRQLSATLPSRRFLCLISKMVSFGGPHEDVCAAPKATTKRLRLIRRRGSRWRRGRRVCSFRPGP